MNGRDSRIDAVRLFCNLLVVLAHTHPFTYNSARGFEFWSCTFVSRYFATSVLSGLFLLSGYLAVRNYGMAVWAKKLFILYPTVVSVCYGLYFIGRDTCPKVLRLYDGTL